MKTSNTKAVTSTFKPVQLTALAISLAFGTAALCATAADNDTMIGWQSSLATEFVKLDSSGNGLVMPLEASKGKAFSKKTFAKADADNDGTIDQNEYINYKTSLGEKNIPADTMAASGSNTSGMSTEMQTTAAASATSDQPEPKMDTAEMSQDSTDAKKRSVGVVIDDSVITTKAKAAIFNTPDLKTLDISVQTRQGEVVLTGSVANEAAKMKAEEVVKSVGGVTSVTNNLEVKS